MHATAKAWHHAQKIVALSEIYGVEKVQRALEDAWAYQAFSCEYIANTLEQRERPVTQPGALHLTRQQDLLDQTSPRPISRSINPKKEVCHERHRNLVSRTVGHAQTGGRGRTVCGTGHRGRTKAMAACGLSGPAH